MLFTQRDYDKEIDFLKKEVAEIKQLLENGVQTKTDKTEDIHNMDFDNIVELTQAKNNEKILACIGNISKINILTALLKQNLTVAELVDECSLNSTGQAYHHMKPLLVAELISMEEKGKYAVNPNKINGIKMLISSIHFLND